MDLKIQKALEPQKPSVGRIVHYVSYGTPGGEFLPEHRAPIITAVREVEPIDGEDNAIIQVDLCIINPSGLFFNTNIKQDEDTKKGGTWHFPERV